VQEVSCRFPQNWRLMMYAGYEAVWSWLPLAAVAMPLFFALVIYVVERRSWKLRNGLSVIGSVITLLLVLAMYPSVAAGLIVECTFPQVMPPLGVSFRVDPLAFLLAATIGVIWLFCTVYSTEYMAREHHKNRYYPFLMLTLAGCLGTVVSGDLFSLFVFFELMSLAAFVLVIHEETREAIRAGFKYLVMTIVGSLALFLGIIVTYELSGSLTLGTKGLINETSGLAFLGFMGYLLGFGIKAGVVPLHVWLPDAHPVAPSPASALLSGLMIKTGAYGLIRVFYNIYGRDMIAATGWNGIVLALAAITMLLGSMVAIVQDDLKRRLAYSSIGQMGYILLGLGLLTETGLVGDIFHIFSHAFMKSTLFLCAGAIIFKTGKRSVKELAGLGMRMPVTMGAFTVASLGMVGVPPFTGFLSKWNLALGAVEAGQFAHVLLLLLSSLMNLAYYSPIVILAFFGGSSQHEAAVERISEAPIAMLVSIVALAMGTVVFDLLPGNLPFFLTQISAKYLFH